MAAAAMAVHLPKPKLPLDQYSNFLDGSLKLGRPMSVNREIKGPVMVSASSTSKIVVTDDVDGDRSKRFYINFTGFPFPLGPFLNRRTIRTEAVKGCIWMFEQEQALGFSSVSTNIRMTVIKLKSGGLWVHAPIAPTKECIQLIKELGAPIEYIVLPTFAYEHKIFVGPFSRKFPNAQVRDWIDEIARDWRFKRIIPAHFEAPINAGRSEFLAAFGFLDDLLGERYVTRPSLSILFTSLMGKAASYFPPDDMRTLSSLDQFLVSVGAVKKTVGGRKGR